MPSSRASSDRAIQAKINAAMAKDPGMGPPRTDVANRSRFILGAVQPTTEEDKLEAGKYVRRWAVQQGLRMRDIQDMLDMLGVP